jgi:putative intracellular protease/amidase
MLSGLRGSKVAILCAGEADTAQLEAARKTLADAGASPVVIPTDLRIEDAHPADFAGLVLLGTCVGHQASDAEPSSGAVEFVRQFMATDKPVGALGSGARLLVAADAVAGRTLTSSVDLAGDIHRAGGDWVDRPVEVDDTLITGRSSADMPMFTDRVVREFSQFVEQRQADQLSEQSFPASDPPPGPVSGTATAHDTEQRAEARE